MKLSKIKALKLLDFEQSGNCRIVGYEGEDETELHITFRPMMFFLNFTYKANRVWFYKTTNSQSVISVPAFGMYGQYVVYFPKL